MRLNKPFLIVACKEKNKVAKKKRSEYSSLGQSHCIVYFERVYVKREKDESIPKRENIKKSYRCMN